MALVRIGTRPTMAKCCSGIWMVRHILLLGIVQSLIKLNQARSQEFALGGGGAVLDTGKNIKQSWPRFKSIFDQFESVFRPNWGDLQKKKVFTQIQSLFQTNFRSDPKQKLQFCGPNHSKSFTTSDRQSRWKGYFHFWSKNRPQKY